MANDLNRHECIGRLGQDPEIKYLTDGKAVCNLSVACGSSWKDKNTGAKEERTEWIRYVAFGRLAEIMGEYLRKGSKVYLSGELRTRKWQDQGGEDRYTTEIVASDMQMLDSRTASDGGHQQQSPAPQQQQRPVPAPRPSGHPQGMHDQHPQAAPGFDDFDDDIPFSNPYKGMYYVV